MFEGIDTFLYDLMRKSKKITPIIALRLKAYREYAELHRPNLLTLVARKTGSPASHLVSQTPDLDPQNT